MRKSLSLALILSCVPLALVEGGVAHAARVFVVNSTADGADAQLDGVCQTSTAGQCTLRAALTEANAVTSEHVTINFNIGGTGVRRIRVFSRLPLIDNGSAGITIDGFSQPGSQPNTDALVDNAVRLVEVIGNGPNGHDGIIMLGSNNVLRGMVVRSFKRAVRITGRTAQFNQVVGNIIGLQANGALDPSYTRVVGSPCVDINNGANRNRVGMPGNANRNVISGCYEKAVVFYNEFTWQNYVQNNILGLDPTGTQRRQNDFGVDINWSANGTIVGGVAFQERNLISGNINAGVEISHGTGTINNKVIGNLIGTDPTGNFANAQTVTSDVGVRLEGAINCATTSNPCPLDASKSTVTDNVIVNSQWGGIIVDKGTHHSTIARNRIGVTLNGTIVGNTNFGIRLAAGAQSMMIGPDNVIVGSTGGVEIVPFSSQPPGTTLHPTHYNTITRNSIDDKSGFGIDFYPFGQVNSPGNAHPSVNEGVIPPTLTMSSTSVRATTCASCTVELYRTNRAPGGHGPGITFLASAAADASGVATFAQPTGGWGGVLTATTRTTNGSTSEFATNIDPGGGGGGGPTVTVTSVSPNVLGQDASHREVRVNGSGFGAGTTASFGAGVTVNATTVTSSTVLTLKVSVAANATVGARDVVVSTTSGNATCGGCFSVAVAPTITARTPATWAPGSSGVLTITGSNFSGTMAVLVSGTGVTVGTVTRISATEVRANLTVAASAPLGERTVTVRNGNAGRAYTTITIGTGGGATMDMAATTTADPPPDTTSTTTSSTTTSSTTASTTTPSTTTTTPTTTTPTTAPVAA
jgi:hypothetical protein